MQTAYARAIFNYMTLEEVRDPSRARAVLRRARRIRARNGVKMKRYGTLAEAIALVSAEIEREAFFADRALAIRTLAYVMGLLCLDPVRYRREYEERLASTELRKRRPSGVSRTVWHEIVDATGGRCLFCGMVASGVGRLEDGTPAPACPAHVEGAT